MRRIAFLIASISLVLAMGAGPVAARQPGSTIAQTVIAVNRQTGGFDHLLAAIRRAGLVGTLDGNRQFTVFAPTDAAFERLFSVLGVSGVSDIPVSTLRTVLLYHVAPGQRSSDVVVSSDRIRTIGKGFLRPSVHDGSAWINDARITTPDVDVSNGVIHVIDRVLLP